MTPAGINTAPLVWLAVAVPALNPFAPGPSPQAPPLLSGGLCVAVLLVFFRVHHVRTVIWAWLFAAVISAAFAIAQYLGLAHHLAPWVSVSELGEAYGNLRQRNQLATLTNMGLAALLWCLQDRWRAGGRLPAWASVAAGCALMVLAAGNAASSSRVGLVGLLAIVALTAGWASPWRARLLAVGAAATVVYVVSAIALPWLLTQAYGIPGQNVFMRLIDAQGCSSRRVLWGNVLQLIAQKPWTGWGLGELDYAHYATLYPGERFCAILDNAHNLPLHLAAELGVPVAVLACAAIGLWVFKAAPWRASSPSHRLAWLILAVIGLHSLVEYPLWYAPFHMAAGLCIVFLLLDRGCPALNSSARTLPLRVGLALVLVGLLTFAWKDYLRVSQAYLPYDKRNAATRDLPPTLPPAWAPFRNQALFAQFTTTALTVANARDMARLGSELLHYSPEPRVIEILIESLMLSQRQDEALWHAARYRAAFPGEYAAWIANGTRGGSTSP